MNTKMCEYCLYYEYDRQCDEYACVMDMTELDEDEYAALCGQPDRPCPFYRMGDEYTIVHKQN